MKNPNLTERHLLTNKMDVNLDVLRATMLNRVGGHVDSTHIVAEDDVRGAERTLKLVKKLTKPTTLSHGTILGLGTGARNCGLAFGGPGHKVITEVDTIT